MSKQNLNYEVKQHSSDQNSEVKNFEIQISKNIQNHQQESIANDLEAAKVPKHEEKLKIVTFDEALNDCGGFGFFQYFSTIFLMIVYSSNGYLFYALSYLNLFPEYTCPLDMPNCTYLEKCRNPDIVTVNWENTKSLNNWVQKLGLECVDPYKIGLLGTMYFAGWTISCAICPRLADLFGRKKIAIISIGVSICCYVGLIFSSNITLSIVLFFFFGLSSAGKSSNGYIYMMELIPQKNQTLIGTLMNFADGSTMIIMSLYFRFISKNWMYYQICGLFATFIAFIACFFIPESPKYYYANNKFDKSRVGLDYIKRFNNKFSCRKDKQKNQRIQNENKFEQVVINSSPVNYLCIFDKEITGQDLKLGYPEIVIESSNDLSVKNNQQKSQEIPSVAINPTNIKLSPALDSIQSYVNNHDQNINIISCNNFEEKDDNLNYPKLQQQQNNDNDLILKKDLDAFAFDSNSSDSSPKLGKTLTIKNKSLTGIRKISEQTQGPDQDEDDERIIDGGILELIDDQKENEKHLETGDIMIPKIAQNHSKFSKKTPKIIQDFLSDKHQLINLLAILIIWIVTGFTFFLINFQMKYIEGDIFINTIVSSCSEIAGYLISGIIYGKLGPKWSFIAAYLFAVAGGLFYIFLGEIYASYVPIMILMTKFGVAASFNMVYLVNNIFPNQHQSTILGFMNCFCRFSSAIAPQVAELNKPNPMISFCVMGALACISSLFINDQTQLPLKVKKVAKIQNQ
eukprot:403338627